MSQPPEPRETAWGHVWRSGLAWKYGNLDWLLEIGLRASRLARWAGLEEDRIAEGPYLVHTWPPEVWATVIRELEHPPVPPEPKIPVIPPGPQNPLDRYRDTSGKMLEDYDEAVPWDGDDIRPY